MRPDRSESSNSANAANAANSAKSAKSAKSANAGNAGNAGNEANAAPRSARPPRLGPLFDRSLVARLVEDLRARDAVRRVVLANGCFDLLHVGHVRYLEEAKAQGDFLVVALNTDESVRALKGAGRPLMPLAERAELLRALRCVDVVTSFGEATLEATLREIRPDVHAKGTDYTSETVPERAVDLELGIEIAICGDAKTRSTTQIVQRLASDPRA